MKARIAPGYDKCRQKLSNIVPIGTPFTLFVTPAQVCNFRCNYCTQSLTKEQKGEIGFQSQLQTYDLFMRIAEQASEFPEKFKRVLLTGLGEPLMNQKIPDMVAMLKELGVAHNYEIFTNASLLTQKMSQSLLDAGLTCLRISIQGLTGEKYREVTGRDIDFEEFVDNIRYFFQRRNKCRVYIKIIDRSLETEDDKERFFSLFGDMCDDIFVEHLTKAQPSMGDYGNRADSTLTFYGEESEERDVCPYVFYTLQTDVLGNVFPCPPLGLPSSFSLGNVCNTTLQDIWNGKMLKELRVAHLNRLRHTIEPCFHCSSYMCFTPKEDNLDDDSEAIIDRMNVGA